MQVASMTNTHLRTLQWLNDRQWSSLPPGKAFSASIVTHGCVLGLLMFALPAYTSPRIEPARSIVIELGSKSSAKVIEEVPVVTEPVEVPKHTKDAVLPGIFNDSYVSSTFAPSTNLKPFDEGSFRRFSPGGEEETTQNESAIKEDADVKQQQAPESNSSSMPGSRDSFSGSSLVPSPPTSDDTDHNEHHSAHPVALPSQKLPMWSDVSLLFFNAVPPGTVVDENVDQYISSINYQGSGLFIKARFEQDKVAAHATFKDLLSLYNPVVDQLSNQYPRTQALAYAERNLMLIYVGLGEYKAAQHTLDRYCSDVDASYDDKYIAMVLKADAISTAGRFAALNGDLDVADKQLGSALTMYAKYMGPLHSGKQAELEQMLDLAEVYDAEGKQSQAETLRTLAAKLPTIDKLYLTKITPYVRSAVQQALKDHAYHHLADDVKIP